MARWSSATASACRCIRPGISWARRRCGSNTRGEVWVASGDYKIEPDGTCAPFEPIRCHAFISESTFGLPIYRWRPQAEIAAEINHWWRRNAEAGRASVVFAYSLGKAQRVLALLDPAIGPILVARRRRADERDLSRARRGLAGDLVARGHGEGASCARRWCWRRPPPPAPPG